MLEAIAKLGFGGGIGVLIGIAAVWWVEPTTGQGAALLVVIALLFSLVFVGIISHIVDSKKQGVVVGSEKNQASGEPRRGRHADARKHPRRSRS